MFFAREKYLNQLKERMNNGQIKVITGIRRSGKSYLLFNIFSDYLKSEGVPEHCIIKLALDDDFNEKYRNPKVLSEALRSKISNSSEQYYVLLDEIQYAISKAELKNHDEPVKLYGVLNGLLHLGNVDVYVTGSNSKMLSKDIMTEFRGRGDVVEIHPLSFKEFYDAVGGERSIAFEDYAMYGGLPMVWNKKSDETKFKYLYDLFKEVYYKDILERYNVEYPQILDEMTDVLCSSVGSLTNVAKIANTLRSVKKCRISNDTIANYLEYLSDAFLFRQAKRFDVKGKNYFQYPSKYYCEDIGLRNVKLNMRQQEESHIMENIIYNDLIAKGYSIDVGVVKIKENTEENKQIQKNCEIDFVANKGMKRYYIQSSLVMLSPEKIQQEERPLLAVKDSYKKIIVTKTMQKPWYDDYGILHMGIYDLLLQEDFVD